MSAAKGRIALLTHSTKPRGSMVHTLCLAEALHAAGQPVHLVAMGDPAVGLFRPTRVPHTILPGPSHAGTTLDERVFATIDVLTAALGDMAGEFDVLHAQDCLTARAAARVRDGGARVTVVRTVHHVDDFTTRALIDCQRDAIVRSDHVLVVSEQWRSILRDEYGVDAEVVPNGVDLERFGPVPASTRAELRERIGAIGRFLFLSVGGVEPRKGTVHAFRALARLRGQVDPPPVLAIVGGHSFQDFAAYRDDALASLHGLGLELGRDVVLLGSVDEAELGAWYATADAFAFPSVKEGFGLVALEAIHAGLPVVASDLPVLREYLVDGRSALLPPVGDEVALADAMWRLITDPPLRAHLRANARAVLPGYTWAASAARHRDFYTRIGATPPPGPGAAPQSRRAAPPSLRRA